MVPHPSYSWGEAGGPREKWWTDRPGVGRGRGGRGYEGAAMGGETSSQGGLWRTVLVTGSGLVLGGFNAFWALGWAAAPAALCPMSPKRGQTVARTPRKRRQRDALGAGRTASNRPCASPSLPSPTAARTPEGPPVPTLDASRISGAAEVLSAGGQRPSRAASTAT